MVAIMVLIGGVTRLTGSGLSMTDWKPITGWLPPLSEHSWQEEFGRYQTSPQYQKINMHMDVHEFTSTSASIASGAPFLSAYKIGKSVLDRQRDWLGRDWLARAEAALGSAK